MNCRSRARSPVTLDDLEPREYDYEGALRDLREREAGA